MHSQTLLWCSQWQRLCTLRLRIRAALEAQIPSSFIFRYHILSRTRFPYSSRTLVGVNSRYVRCVCFSFLLVVFCLMHWLYTHPVSLKTWITDVVRNLSLFIFFYFLLMSRETMALMFFIRWHPFARPINKAVARKTSGCDAQLHGNGETIVFLDNTLDVTFRWWRDARRKSEHDQPFVFETVQYRVSQHIARFSKGAEQNVPYPDQTDHGIHIYLECEGVARFWRKRVYPWYPNFHFQ